MKIGVIMLSLITILLLMNVVLYASSEDYRFFIKKIKYPDEIIYSGDAKNESKNIQEKQQKKPQKPVSSGKNIKETEEEISKIEVNEKNTGPVALSLTAEEILDNFSIFDLKRKGKGESIFGITKEYPDIYFEYYSKNLTLYFFPTKDYEAIRDIFNVLAFDLPITINQVNNFGDRSFYINLKKGYEDNFIRIVISYKGEVFGLKVEQSIYGKIKNILSNLGEKREVSKGEGEEK